MLFPSYKVRPKDMTGWQNMNGGDIDVSNLPMETNYSNNLTVQFSICKNISGKFSILRICCVKSHVKISKTM